MPCAYMPPVRLTAAGWTAEELFAEWQHMSVLRSWADRFVTDYRAKWDQTTDPIQKDLLWSDLEAMWPQFQVLSAWTEVFYSAYVFACHGPASVFLPDDLMPVGQPIRG